MKKTILGILLIFAGFYFTGCSRGAVTVNQQINPNGRLSAKPLVDKMYQQGSPWPVTQAEVILSDLKKSDPERFDWDEFWSLLAKRGPEIVIRYPRLLLGLHSKNCSSYPAFVSFLNDVARKQPPVLKLTHAYVMGSERECPTKLPPTIAMEFHKRVHSFYQDGEVGPDIQAKLFEKASDFIGSEMENSPYSAPWVSVIAENEAHLVAAQKKLLDSALWQSSYRLAKLAARNFRNHELLRSFIARGLSSQWSPWLKATPFDEVFEQIQLVSKKEKPALTEDAFSTLIPKVKELLKQDRLIDGIRVLYLAREHSEHLSKLQQLRFYDDLLREVEDYLLKASTSRRSKAITSLEAECIDKPWEQDRIFLALRMGVEPLDPESLFRKISEETTVGFAMTYFAKMFFSKDVEFKERLTKNYCTELNRLGIPNLDYPEDPYHRDNLGCLTYHNASLKFIFPPSTLLRLPFSSVLYAETDVSLQPPVSGLGTIVLKNPKNLDEPLQKTTPTPASSNAIVFPLLVGLTVEKPTPRFKAGTHFFVIHHIARKAKPGEAEPHKAKPGLRGPNLSFKGKYDIPVFNFLSIGGAGQKGAASRPGGKGDSSSIDSMGVARFLEAFAGLNPDVALPLLLEEQLNFAEASELFKIATRTPQGKIKVYVAPRFTSLLTNENQAKILDRCKEQFEGKVPDPFTRSHIDECLKNQIVPSAISQVEDLLNEARENAFTVLEMPVPELNLLEPLKLSQASSGPPNADGPRGKPGELLREYGWRTPE